ncbi:YfhD family protein [Paenibacillus sp. NPDC058071]|uniref:YfhD family protein n=1 Tax=Paenibacillus sp. NPDC058071 TaxID=3346326 RepID=UPI0036D77EAF
MTKANDNALNDLEKQNFGDLPIAENEDVEFSEELADEDDRVANERAAQADKRVKGSAENGQS